MNLEAVFETCIPWQVDGIDPVFEACASLESFLAVAQRTC